MKNRVIVIGLDGATFTLLRPWMAEGKLPTLKALADQGVSGELESTIPPVTSPAWPCFMTGKNPANTGVYGFLNKRTGSYDEALVNSTSIATSTLWELLSQAGKRVGVLHVPVTYPPRPVNGVLIGDFLTPAGKRDFTYPAELLADIEDHLGEYYLTFKSPPGLILANPSIENIRNFLADCWEMTTYQFNVARYLMDRYEFDFLIHHLLATDRIQHGLWHILDPTHPRHDAHIAQECYGQILDFYREIDRQIGLLLAQAGTETNVIVMSDHGFGPCHTLIDLNAWLLREGYLQVKSHPASRIRYLLWSRGFTQEFLLRAFIQRVFRVGVIQRFLTRRITKRMNFSDAFKLRSQYLAQSQKGQYKTIRVMKRILFSLDDIDWANSRAYARTGYGEIILNLVGREPHGTVRPGREYEELRDEIVQKLKDLVDPATGERVNGLVYIKEDIYNGKYGNNFPDIVFNPLANKYVPLNPLGFVTNKVFTVMPQHSGQHRLEGIFLAKGPYFRQGEHLSGARIIDLAPTILHLFNVPIPDDMDGTVLAGALTEEFRAGHPIRLTKAISGERQPTLEMSKEEQETVLERLRGLGYIDD